MEKTRKRFTGTVTSDKMDKTRVVAVVDLKKHPIYGKFVKTRKKYKVHDANNDSHVGDKIMIEECRPISKTVRWNLVDIVEKSEG